MAYEVKGVVARSKGAPVSVETIVVPDPGPGGGWTGRELVDSATIWSRPARSSYSGQRYDQGGRSVPAGP